MDSTNFLKSHIRTVPDWPAPGVQFRDITPLLQDPRVFRVLIDTFVHRYMEPSLRPTVVAGLDARGFIIGSVVAYELGLGFVPIRKKGKLPHRTVSISYALEYGTDEMEIHLDAVAPGEKVILVDDLIATGGTATAAVQLLQKIGAKVEAACFVIDLPDLGGRHRSEGKPDPDHGCHPQRDRAVSVQPHPGLVFHRA